MNTPDRSGLLDPNDVSPTPSGRSSSTKAKRARNTPSASPSRSVVTRSLSRPLAQSPPAATPDAKRPELSSEHETDATSYGEASIEPQDQTQPTSTPPSSAARKSSVPKKFKPIGSWEVNEKLENELRQTQDTAKGLKEGYNYVFSVVTADGSSLIKIGIASQVETRRRDIAAKCGHKEVKTLNHNQRRISEYKTAEKLIKIELHNFRYQFDCICKVSHEEYFKVDENVALDVTQRWTAFCETKPWDEKGTLHPFWKNRLQKLPRKSDHCEKPEEHEPLAERWSKFTNATQWAVLSFNATSVQRAIQPWRWHWVSLFQALYLAYVTFPDPMSAGCLVALVIWMLGERDLLGVPILWTIPRSLKQIMDDDLGKKKDANEETEGEDEMQETQEISTTQMEGMPATPTPRRMKSA
ncbi:hypothetical protein TOPH_06425 [Tolypocladium ophioglossoides CBS 100239]|uniref:Bacteriophage T5 Orf172 DNA-binding domain-containing protein n=1 Tax=Tolypocladium ophioglossoides (strain CBS 100239) TaxID=1163406 RepID=A0A0L0N4Y2_TOLOC|nr:hypothetical protein TOPH_06425 [Tolypocladium ophioglossoides CBS 100239]